MKIAEILEFLRPEGGWIVNDNNFEEITWIFGNPISLEEFEIGKKKFESHLAEKESRRANLLERLGITEEEAKLLLS